jgi:hypothetical protein
LRLEDVAVGIEIATLRFRHGANGIGRRISGKETMMERQSTHHSPRVDEEMERETRSLTQGAPIEAREPAWRMMEAPADGEPLPDAVVSMNEIELRSLLAASLRPSAFPGDREVLLKVAGEEHADQLVVDLLYALPPDKVFATPEAVWEQLGGKVEVREQPHSEPTAAPAPERTPSPERTAARERTAAPERRVEPEPKTTPGRKVTPDVGPADFDAHTAPLIVKGAALAVSVSVGAAALAIGVVREVCGRVRRLF